VAGFLGEEAAHVAGYVDELNERNPFKRGPPPAPGASDRAAEDAGDAG
jgi:hypothetical protein